MRDIVGVENISKSAKNETVHKNKKKENIFSFNVEKNRLYGFLKLFFKIIS